MKKIFTFLTMAALMGSYAMASNEATSNKLVKKPVAEFLKKHEEKAKKSRVATRDLPTTDIIYNPDGKLVIYYKNSTGMDYSGYYEAEDMAANIVFGDNNEVYIQDILNWGDESYVKGEIDGDKINFSLPQTIGDYGWYSINLAILEAVGDEDYELVSDIDSVEYSYNAQTGEISLNLPGEPEQYILGYVYTDDESWTYSGDFTQEYRVFDGVINSMPEGLETEVYMINDGEYGHPVNIAFTDDMMYIEGLPVSLPKSVIYANLDGNTASIAQNQNIGAVWGYFIYTKVLDADEELADEDVEYTLSIDRENKIITSANPQDIFCLNGSLEEVMYLEIYQDFTMKVQESFAGIPVNPTGLLYDDYYEDYDMSLFAFNIPNFSIDGNVLLPDNLYYRVFVDGDLYEFSEDEYFDVEGEMTEVPFMFDNGYDLYWSTQTQRVVMFYFLGASTFGVQTVYDYEGVITESDIVTLDIESGEVTETPAGIENTINSDIKNKVYYDLNGRKVMNPEKGIYIMKATTSEGAVVTKKIVVR